MPINNSTSPAIHRWLPGCWLRVTGEDAAHFLQGQFTNDLRLLDRQASVYGLWLTLKGKVLADSFVLRGGQPNEFWIGSYFSPAAVIRERLESHVIADDVTVEDLTGAWTGTCVLDGGIEDRWMAAPASTGFVFSGRRNRGRSMEWVYPSAETEPPPILALSAVVLDEDEMTRRRIDAGIPAVPMDVGPGDLPNEAGLEAEAISYTKGCYLGQEVMARLKSMGQVRRRLWRATGKGEVWPSLPAPVFAGQRQVGELRSAVRDGTGGWLGLAMVSLMHVGPGAELAFVANGVGELRLNASP